MDPLIMKAGTALISLSQLVVCDREICLIKSIQGKVDFPLQLKYSEKKNSE